MGCHQGHLTSLVFPKVAGLKNYYQDTLQHPDERQLAKGIVYTNVPMHLKNLVDSLVWESTRTEEGYVLSS